MPPTGNSSIRAVRAVANTGEPRHIHEMANPGPALKPQYERFAQLRASGKTGSEALRIIIGHDARNPDARADRWMKSRGVRERVAELCAENAAKCSLTREHYVQSLVEMYKAKPEEASMSNPLCDVLVTRGQKHAVFPPKLVVGAQLAKVLGWERPTEVKLEAGENLASFLGRLFRAGGTLSGNESGNGHGGHIQHADIIADRH